MPSSSANSGKSPVGRFVTRTEREGYEALDSADGYVALEEARHDYEAGTDLDGGPEVVERLVAWEAKPLRELPVVVVSDGAATPRPTLEEPTSTEVETLGEVEGERTRGAVEEEEDGQMIRYCRASRDEIVDRRDEVSSPREHLAVEVGVDEVDLRPTCGPDDPDEHIR